MFQLQALESVRWPVHVEIPRDGGKTVKATFNCEFKMYDQDALDALTNGKKDHEILQEATLGWDSVTNELKEDLPFSTDALEKMTKIPYVRRAMLSAFFEAIQGIERKN